MDLAVWWVIHNRCSLSEEQGGSCVVTGGSQSPDKQRSVLDDKQGSHLSTMQLVPILLLEKAFYISQDIWYFFPPFVLDVSVGQHAICRVAVRMMGGLVISYLLLLQQII